MTEVSQFGPGVGLNISTSFMYATFGLVCFTYICYYIDLVRIVSQHTRVASLPSSLSADSPSRSSSAPLPPPSAFLASCQATTTCLRPQAALTPPLPLQPPSSLLHRSNQPERRALLPAQRPPLRPHLAPQAHPHRPLRQPGRPGRPDGDPVPPPRVGGARRAAESPPSQPQESRQA